MDAVEFPLSAVTVSKIMRSGCGGVGGVTTVELVGSSQSERDACSSFHPHRDKNCAVNGSRSAFWNKMSDAEPYRQASQLSSPGNEEASVDQYMEENTRSSFDMASMPDAKQSLRKAGKATKNNGNCSRRSRVAHIEASLHVSTSVDMNGLPKELGSYPGKCNIAVTEKTQTANQKTSVSGKRSDKRNGKVRRSKCDTFSVKAGLSSFSSAAGGNNIFGMYGSKEDICDLTKHVDEFSLNELLEGSYKCPLSVKDKGKKAENLNENILHSVREACSILQLQKPTQMADQNASSCLPSSGTSEAGRSDEVKGAAVDLSSSNKVEDTCSGLIDHAKTFESPLFTPKDVLDRLALPPSRDLDLLLLDGAKPSLTSKGNQDPRLGKTVHNRGGLPTFPWSYVSGWHSKTNADAGKLNPSRITCQGRWVKMGNSTTCLAGTTAFVADLESLTYDQSLVPLDCQQPSPTEKEKTLQPALSDATFEQGVMPSGTDTVASKTPAEHSPVVLEAAQTLCDIAARFRKQDQNEMTRWLKKPAQKPVCANKLKCDEKLEKALFAIPSLRAAGPSNPVNCTNEATIHSRKRLRPSIHEKSNDLSNNNLLTKRQFWPTTTPESSRSSPSKPCKDGFTEAKRHDSSPMKRPLMTPPPTSVQNKPSKLRKLVPMEWRSRTDQKGNGKH